MVSCHKRKPVLAADRLDDQADALIDRFDSLNGGICGSRVADHVAIGEIHDVDICCIGLYRGSQG